jgi:aminocarboxymuconate-semialdehyde decarboxylase
VVIEECQGNGVDVQVVCTVPVMFSYWTKPEHGAEISRFLNDHLASVVSRYPRKFIALGTVPMQHTDLAIRELRRCKEELGFPGVQIGSHVEPNAFTGRDYDLNLSDQKLLPFFEAANDLDMSILVHPWEMMGFDVMQKYWLPWLVGMPAETSRAICSMIFGGVFEKYRKLKVCFAHGGGSFPFTIGRIEHGFNCRPDLVAVDNNVNPREYLKKDSRPARFWVDSIVHDPYSLRTLVGIFGSRRICMGSDYPFPLGEKPGELIINNPNISGDSMRRLLADNTLEFLGLDLADYANSGQSATELSRTDN